MIKALSILLIFCATTTKVFAQPASISATSLQPASAQSASSSAQRLGASTSSIGKLNSAQQPIFAGSSAVSSVQSQAHSSPAWVAYLALAVSLVSLVLTFVKMYLDDLKDKKARKTSIDDDYWFRKILAPASVEPLLRGILELINDFPFETDDESNYKVYAQDVTRKFITLQTSIKLLVILHKNLPEKITEKLTKCEDVLTEGAGKLALNKKNKILIAGETKESALNALLSALADIKQGHFQALK